MNINVTSIKVYLSFNLINSIKSYVGAGGVLSNASLGSLSGSFFLPAEGRKKEKEKNHHYAQVIKDLQNCICRKSSF